LPEIDQVAAKNAITENASLKEELAAVKAQLDSTKKALATAQDLIEQGERAKMIPTIMATFKMTKEEVNALDTAEMSRLVETSRLLRTPVAGVQPEAGELDKGRLTVGDKFAWGHDKRRGA